MRKGFPRPSVDQMRGHSVQRTDTPPLCRSAGLFAKKRQNLRRDAGRIRAAIRVQHGHPGLIAFVRQLDLIGRRLNRLRLAEEVREEALFALLLGFVGPDTSRGTSPSCGRGQTR